MSVQIWKANALAKTSLLLGEGAIWHPGWGKFLYVDILGEKVGCIDPITKERKEVNVGRKIGVAVPADNGKLIAALQGSIAQLETEKGTLDKLIDIEPGNPENRCNDGRCDAMGRLWIGVMNVNALPREGALYRFDDSLTKMLENTSVSNGICWSKDNCFMYYIDSLDYNVKMYDFDLKTGSISNERVIITIEEEGCMPDGMCMDEEGKLWIAMWGEGCIRRYEPDSGNLIGKVIVEAPHVTNCSFGGDNMQQLFITTAREGLSEEELERFPLSGALFIADTGIRGLGINYFKTSK